MPASKSAGRTIPSMKAMKRATGKGGAFGNFIGDKKSKKKPQGKKFKK